MSNQSTSTNKLYYSNKCETSKAVICMLRNEGILDKFVLYCVDDPKIFNLVKGKLQKVPTMIIPSCNGVFVAAEIFSWFRKIKENRQIITSSINTQISQNKIQQKTTDIKEHQHAKNPHGYNTNEMAGMSDTYAYTNSELVPMHNYIRHTDVGNDTIYTAPERAGKLHNAQYDIYIKELTDKRSIQDNELKDITDKQREYASSNNVDFVEKNNKLMDNIIQIVNKQQQNLLIR